MEKREIIQLKKWTRQRGFSAWDIQTGPFAALCTSHILKLFQLFHLHTGRPILVTREGQLSEIGILPTPKLDETEGFQCLGGIQTGPFAALCTIQILISLPFLHFHTGRPILITPERGRQKMRKWKSPKMDDTQVFECLGH